jgi:ribosomal protein L15E
MLAQQQQRQQQKQKQQQQACGVRQRVTYWRLHPAAARASELSQLPPAGEDTLSFLSGGG